MTSLGLLFWGEYGKQSIRANYYFLYTYYVPRPMLSTSHFKQLNLLTTPLCWNYYPLFTEGKAGLLSRLPKDTQPKHIQLMWTQIGGLSDFKSPALRTSHFLSVVDRFLKLSRFSTFQLYICVYITDFPLKPQPKQYMVTHRMQK